MKKIIVSILSLALVAVSSFAQEPALSKGNSIINAGVGFSSGLSDIALPPISLSYEYMCTTFGTGDNMGISAGVFGGVFTQKFLGSSLICGGICAQGNFHYMPIAKLDLYAGLYAGYAKVGVEGISTGESAVGGQIGVRYFFSNAVGGFLQVGGFSTINLGVAFKF